LDTNIDDDAKTSRGVTIVTETLDAVSLAFLGEVHVDMSSLSKPPPAFILGIRSPTVRYKAHR
jgi:hypothetical protein